MRKAFVVFAVLAALVVSGSPAMAHGKKGKKQEGGFCPIQVLNHSKELKLTSKQTRGLKDIKAQLMKDMDALKAKNNSAVADILTDSQAAKYRSLSHEGCCGMKERGKK